MKTPAKLLLLALVLVVAGSAQSPGPSLTGAVAVNNPLPLIRASNLTYNATATSLTATMPTGAASGDFCVLIFAGQNSGLNTPSGWTQEQYSGQSYWNGAFYYKTLASGDITGGVTITTGGSASPMFIALVDFIGATSGYNNSASTQNTTSPASNTISQYSNYNGKYSIYVSSYRGSAAGTITTAQPGTTLLQSYGAGTAGAIGVYAQVLPNVASQLVTAYFPGTYSPQGYYAGWLLVSP